MSEHERVRQRLFTNFTRMLKECEQTIRDSRYWNTIHPTENPVDCEWFIVQAAGLRKSIRALARNEYLDPSWIQTS